MNSLGGDKMDKTCGILFSGGLDSSLAVCEMIENGYGAYLFHYDTGALISNNLVDIRYKELKEVYRHMGALWRVDSGRYFPAHLSGRYYGQTGCRCTVSG